uniref:Uncharacterized protein n=1 Tax=Opuntia streptacantha TaxID=393608 RepID=A0A7C9A590_OPUST
MQAFSKSKKRTMVSLINNRHARILAKKKWIITFGICRGRQLQVQQHCNGISLCTRPVTNFTFIPPVPICFIQATKTQLERHRQGVKSDLKQLHTRERRTCGLCNQTQGLGWGNQMKFERMIVS